RAAERSVGRGGGWRGGRGGEGGEGAPNPPLRDRQWLRDGRAALPGRRAGAGLPAVGGVSLPQVRPAEQACVGDDGCLRGGFDAKRRGPSRQQRVGQPREGPEDASPAGQGGGVAEGERCPP